jgi:hypothetical protein
LDPIFTRCGSVQVRDAVENERLPGLDTVGLGLEEESLTQCIGVFHTLLSLIITGQPELEATLRRRSRPLKELGVSFLPAEDARAGVRNLAALPRGYSAGRQSVFVGDNGLKQSFDWPGCFPSWRASI